MTNNKRGRPKLSEAGAVNTSITLTEDQINWLRDYGFGNVSLGVRRLVDEKRGLKEVTLKG